MCASYHFDYCNTMLAQALFKRFDARGSGLNVHELAQFIADDTTTSSSESSAVQDDTVATAIAIAAANDSGYDIHALQRRAQVAPIQCNMHCNMLYTRYI
jgi:hypothetical protein